MIIIGSPFIVARFMWSVDFDSYQTVGFEAIGEQVAMALTPAESCLLLDIPDELLILICRCLSNGDLENLRECYRRTRRVPAHLRNVSIVIWRMRG